MKTISNDCFFARVEAEIRSGRNVRFRVKGNSMRPLLRNGREEVVVAPCKAEDIECWDIVLFRYRGRHVLHRMVGRKGEYFVLQGDAVCTFHEECGAEDIIGVVKRVYSPSGKVVETSSFRWRMKSRLWRLAGRYRGILLRLWSVLGS